MGLVAITTAPTNVNAGGSLTGTFDYWTTEIDDTNSVESAFTGTALSVTATAEDVTITKPTTVNTSATHWAVYRSKDAGSYPIGWRVAKVLIATTTNVDNTSDIDLVGNFQYSTVTINGISESRDGAPPVLLGAGRIVSQKDFPTLIKAFAQVRARRPARLMILGEGKSAKSRDRLAALGRKLGVAEDVALPGFVDNPFPYMARASLFVLSSAWEGLPGVMVEALACGCPVVSTDCPGGAREILDDGAIGSLVPVGDVAALAEAILAALDAPPDPERLRSHAARFTADHAVERYLEVLLADGPRAGLAFAAAR